MIRTVPAPDLPVAREGKHRRVAKGPRFTVFSGDWRGGNQFDSLRQDVWSFTLETISGPWRQDYPFCGPAGEIQAASPDYNAWIWNSRRAHYIALGGLSQLGGTRCPGGATPVLSHMLSFDPEKPTHRWAQTGRKTIESAAPWLNGQMFFYAQYEESSDRAWGFYNDLLVDYHFGGDAWAYSWSTLPAAKIGAGYCALDPQARALYAIDPETARLYRADLKTRAMTDLGRTPWSPGDNPDEAIPMIFSSAKRELRIAWRARLWRYAVDPRQWAASEGPYPGNTLCHDDATDTTICFGAYHAPQPLIYLYTGDGAPPVPLRTFGAVTTAVA